MQPAFTLRRTSLLFHCLCWDSRLHVWQPASSLAPGDGPASGDRAERLLRQNNPTAAAQMYERLAGRQHAASQRRFFAVGRARLAHCGQSPADAQRVLDAAGTTLTPKQGFDRDLLRAEVLLDQGQFTPAWRQVSAHCRAARRADAARLFKLQQQVALRAGLPLDAIRPSSRASALPPATPSAPRRDATCWPGCARRSIVACAWIRPPHAMPIARGWLEMGQIAASAGRSPQAAARPSNAGARAIPGHPAGTVAFAEIVTPAHGRAPLPSSGNQLIGLLLPLTGAQGTSAALVRDGFLAAVAEMPEAARPQVRVYDTGTLPVGTALQNARDRRRGFPGRATDARRSADRHRAARRWHADAAAQQRDRRRGRRCRRLPVRAVARRRSPADRAPGAWLPARNAPCCSRRSGDWGTRVGNAFTEELTRGGGQVLAQANYDPSRNELTAVITQALGVNESRARLSPRAAGGGNRTAVRAAPPRRRGPHLRRRSTPCQCGRSGRS